MRVTELAMLRLLTLVAFPLAATLAASPQIIVLDGQGQVLHEGEFAKEGQTYPKRTLIRVLDANGNRVANTPRYMGCSQLPGSLVGRISHGN